MSDTLQKLEELNDRKQCLKIRGKVWNITYITGPRVNFSTEHGLQFSIYTLLVKSTTIFKTTRDLVSYDFFFYIYYIEDLTRVVISYEIYETSLRRVS